MQRLAVLVIALCLAAATLTACGPSSITADAAEKREMECREAARDRIDAGEFAKGSTQHKRWVKKCMKNY